MNYYTFRVLQKVIPAQTEGEPPLELRVGSEYAGGIVKGGNPSTGYLIEYTKTIEAESPRRAWLLTGWPDSLKKTSIMTIAEKNVFLYDETNNSIGLSYYDHPESISGARIFHLEIVDKFLGITINTHTYPVYFLIKGADQVIRAYQRPKEITYSPEDFYDVTQWKTALDLFKNTQPVLEKITSIMWAAAGLLSLMALFMLIFAGGV